MPKTDVTCRVVLLVGWTDFVVGWGEVQITLRHFYLQVTIHKWPTLDWNFCIPFTWASATEGGYTGQFFDMNSLLTWASKILEQQNPLDDLD